MKGRQAWSWIAGFTAMASLLAGCAGAGKVIYVVATSTPTPAVVIVTPAPPTVTLIPAPTTLPVATALPEEERIPVISQVSQREEPGSFPLIIDIYIPFRDGDGDVNRVHYAILSASTSGLWTEDGAVDIAPSIQQHGASTSGTWTCSDEEYDVSLEIVLQDAAGHSSAPAQVALHCPGAAPTATPSPEPPTATPEPTSTPAPAVPAVVEGRMPDTIPCEAWGDDGCQWDFTVTFTEKAGTPATIERMGRRFVDVKGQEWTVGSEEWSDETIYVYSYGSNTYSSWVRTTNGEDPDLRGGTVIVSWEGTDDYGNSFSGSTSATLASAP